MTDTTVVLKLPDYAIIFAALGIFDAYLDRSSHDDARMVLENCELTEFFENKNEAIAAIRGLHKQLVKQWEDQHDT